MVNYKVTSIQFDFSDSFGDLPSVEYQENLVKRVTEKIWVLDNDLADLVDFITEECGWCISSIDYHEVNEDLFSLLEDHGLYLPFSDEVTWVKQGTFSAVYLINTRDSAFNNKLKDAGLLEKCNDYLFRIS